MIFRDVRDFIEEVDNNGELAFVENADWNLEIGAISEVAATSQSCSAVLFDKIKDYPQGFRLFANPLRKYTRAALAIGLSQNLSPIELVRAWKEKSAAIKPMKPKLVESGPALENEMNEQEVDLFKFPTPIWHRKDGGRYIGTGDIVINQDPDSGWVNLGVYRVQIHDKNTVGLSIERGHHGHIIAEKFWDKGKPCPVAICCGQEPSLWMAAAASLSESKSEYDYAGGLRNEPVEVFEGKETRLPIPATAEIVLEGDFYPPSVESRIEGPFGEWIGYYGSASRPCPVVKVKHVMYRTNPIMMGAPPIRGNSIGLPGQAVGVWNTLQACGVPNVKGVWNHIGGGLFVVISIKQSYPGHAHHAGVAALGSRAAQYNGTFIVVVDDDIDPSNLEEVIWAITTRSQPSDDIDIVRNCWSSYLDPRIPSERRQKGDYVSSRGIIVACRPFTRLEDYPEVSAIDSNTRKETIEKWGKSLRL